MRKKTGTKSLTLGRILYAVSVAVILIIFLFPVLWLLSASIKTQAEAISIPPVWLFRPTLANFKKIFLEEHFLTFLRNSVIVAAGSTFLSLLIGFPAAYALARFRFRGKKDLSFWIISTQMFPPIAVALPFILIMKNLGLVDTRWALIITHLTFNLPFAVWLLQGFVAEIPVELDEAVLVDGGTRLDVLTRVVLPLSAPGLAATSIFCIITSWNEFLFALFLAPFHAKTLPVAAVGLISYGNIFWGHIGAASAVIVVPIFVFAMIVQRYMVRGLSFGAVKG